MSYCHFSLDHCLSVIDLRLLILPLASSNFSLYIDILLELKKERGLKTKLYDKRDDITFPIVIFPFISSNILSLHLTTRTRFWTELSCDAKAIQVRLTYSYVKDIAAKILRIHHDVVDRYDISISEIGMDFFHSMYIFLSSITDGTFYRA